MNHSPQIAALLAACRDLFAAPTYEDYCVREIRTLAEAYAAYEAAEAAPIQPAPVQTTSPVPAQRGRLPRYRRGITLAPRARRAMRTPTLTQTRTATG